ncbi:hypothetical protein E5Q_01728 [Mixia osmundae IAM 14324]|uniref:Uridylate kinase n=1 Tax=Mixia osmundae (strain CBS 9802 / IAM 14324 / JCM 22182 / KY 12970) TaxID=764103 RepID=G7DWX6_MIXOS|nr:hypothetical protein E5Q_01728 [Mixia osmundae IAM 14324]
MLQHLCDSGSSSIVRRPYSVSANPPKPPKGKLSNSPGVILLGLLGIGGIAFLSFTQVVGRRQGQSVVPDAEKKPYRQAQTAFSPEEVTVIFVLGGPGAGKGTQCAKLVDKYNFVHLSAGDLLRAEQDREGSEYGQMIKDYIKEGNIVPMEVTIKLLENAMKESIKKDEKQESRFLIDGFPRKMDQAVKFDDSVVPAKKVLFLTCPESTLLERLLERGKTSGRADDNEESIKKRFKTFIDTSMPVVDEYRKQGKVIEVESVGKIDDIFEKICAGLDPVIS